MRIVTTEAGRRALFALRFRAYEEFMTSADPIVNAEYHDQFDDLSTTIQIGAFDDGRLVGGLRLCFTRPGESLATLPCADYYPALQAIKRSARSSLVEVSRFSIEPDISNTSYRTTLYASLVRASLMAAQAAEVSMILVGTRTDWVRFYKYMLGFELIGEPALYPPGDEKIALLGGSLAQAQLRQRMQNKFFRISAEEVESMHRALLPILEQVEAA